MIKEERGNGKNRQKLPKSGIEGAITTVSPDIKMVMLSLGPQI